MYLTCMSANLSETPWENPTEDFMFSFWNGHRYEDFVICDDYICEFTKRSHTGLRVNFGRQIQHKCFAIDFYYVVQFVSSKKVNS